MLSVFMYISIYVHMHMYTYDSLTIYYSSSKMFELEKQKRNAEKRERVASQLLEKV